MIACITKALQSQKSVLKNDRQSSIGSESALRQTISLFCNEMEKLELSDVKFRKQVANRLQTRNLEASLPSDTREMLEGITSMKDVNVDSPIVDSYIRNKWNISDPKMLLNALEAYLGKVT